MKYFNNKVFWDTHAVQTGHVPSMLELLAVMKNLCSKSTSDVKGQPAIGRPERSEARNVAPGRPIKKAPKKEAYF
jgi:hypothetical protein